MDKRGKPIKNGGGKEHQTMLAQIVTAIGTSFGTLITSLASGVGNAMGMFWDTTASELTPLGEVCIALFIIGLAIVVINKVFDLVSGFLVRR